MPESIATTAGSGSAGATQRLDHARFTAGVERVDDARSARGLEHHAARAPVDLGDDSPRAVRVTLGQQIELEVCERCTQRVAQPLAQRDTVDDVGRRHTLPIQAPASLISTWPVILELSSDARNSTTPVMSSGSSDDFNADVATS